MTTDSAISPTINKGGKKGHILRDIKAILIKEQ